MPKAIENKKIHLFHENITHVRTETDPSEVVSDLLRGPVGDVGGAEFCLNVVPLAGVRRTERAADGQRVWHGVVLAVGH